MSLPMRPLGQSNLRPTPINWLWPRYVAAGKLTLLDGDPGSGKSLLTIDLAARLSRALPLPDGPASPGMRRTLFLNAEDDSADTLLPRLSAAGADLDHIIAPDDPGGLPRLPDDLPLLEATVREFGVGLLVVDSLSAFIPAEIAGSPIAVRQVLAPLALMAARTGMAVMLVRHLTKQTRVSALYRGLGSIGIAGMARTVLLAGPHPADESAHMLTAIKSNLTEPPAPLGYRLVGRDSIGVVEWLGPVATIADPPELPPPPGVVRAVVWLLETLVGGPKPALELVEAAAAAGIGEGTLNQAKSQLQIESKIKRLDGGGRCWVWCPPYTPMPLPEMDPLIELPPMDDW